MRGVGIRFMMGKALLISSRNTRSYVFIVR